MQDDGDFVVDDAEFEFDDELMQELETPQTTSNGTKTNGKSENSKPASPKTVKKEEPKPAPAKRKAKDDSSDDDDFKPAPRATRSTPKKPKLVEASVKKEEPIKTPTKAANKSTQRTPKGTSKASSKQDAKEEEDSQRKAILNSVETVALPDIEPPKGETKFNYRAMAARPGPQNPGSKEIPVGEEDCLTVPFTHSQLKIGSDICLYWYP
jgi:hypothetical protein